MFHVVILGFDDPQHLIYCICSSIQYTNLKNSDTFTVEIAIHDLVHLVCQWFTPLSFFLRRCSMACALFRHHAVAVTSAPSCLPRTRLVMTVPETPSAATPPADHPLTPGIQGMDNTLRQWTNESLHIADSYLFRVVK